MSLIFVWPFFLRKVFMLFLNFKDVFAPVRELSM